MSVPRLRVLAVVGLALAAALTTLASPDRATAGTGYANPLGSDRFTSSRYYRGDFPDPSVLKHAGTWYAYSTSISSLNLPVMASSDLVRWRPVGEGLRSPARWAQSRKVGTRRVALTWAPAVAKVGSRFVHAYTAPVRGITPRRMCISISTSTRPSGGFVDRTTRPFICPSTRGAIDPAFFLAPDGKRYLLWKSEQTKVYPSSLWITRLSDTGTRRSRVSTRLLTTQPGWETPLIENPSMIRFGGRYYLFYSGAGYANSSYATGYAICDTPLGPCRRVSDRPLLETGGKVAGPGGAMAFYDDQKRLRLAYAAWDYGNTGYPTSLACLTTVRGCAQRRMHIATLALHPDRSGALVVTNRG